MKKSDIHKLPEYFHRYIALVPDIELSQSLTTYGNEMLQNELHYLYALEQKVYAPEKWTVQDILQHVIDTERIFSYRALCFAREEHQALPGFDENNYATKAQATKRPLSEILEEFTTVRNSTIKLFASFTKNQLMNEGVSSGINISVLAIGFTIAGHGIHHMNVIKDKYYPLLVV